MKRDSKYKCSHLGDKVITIVDKFSEKLYAGQTEGDNRRYLIGVDNFSEPHLCLAHIANQDCVLTKIKEKQ